jgi:hypothetical protein
MAATSAALEEGIEHAIRATQADEAGDIRLAIDEYKATCEALQRSVAADPDAARAAKTQTKLDGYMRRLQQLCEKVGLPPFQLPPLHATSFLTMPVGDTTAFAPPPAAARSTRTETRGGTTPLTSQATISATITIPTDAVRCMNHHGVEYFVGSKLSSGNFGNVHEAVDVFGQDFVVKILKTNRPKEEVEADWNKEVQFLRSLSHPCIVQLYDAFIFNDWYHLVLERCDHSIRGYVKKYGALPGPDVVIVASQILSGLNHIHTKSIVHRDLHIDNVLFASSASKGRLTVKITDFGISKFLKGEQRAAKTFIGRDYDYAPELVTKGHTTRRSDIYQVGLVLYYLYTGKSALSSRDGNNVMEVVTSGVARRRCTDLNTKLGDILAVFLRRKAEFRYENCAAAWVALKALLK